MSVHISKQRDAPLRGGHPVALVYGKKLAGPPKEIRLKEGTLRVGTLLKIQVRELVYRCISSQYCITCSGRILFEEFLIDLGCVQPVQRGIRLDLPVVASCLRAHSTPVPATR